MEVGPELKATYVHCKSRPIRKLRSVVDWHDLSGASSRARLLSNLDCSLNVKSGRLDFRPMSSWNTIFERMSTRRALTLLACFALLFFAAAVSPLHQHTKGPDAACHVCQSLHAPALTASFSGIASAPQITGWHDSRPSLTAALDDVSLLRSGRAPPSV